LQQLEEQLAEELQQIVDRFTIVDQPIETIAVKPKKTNIQIKLLTLAWVPYRKVDGSLVAAW
jgi:hypothetical protein